MASRISLVRIAPVGTTTATTTPWPLPASPDISVRSILSRFSVDAPYGYLRRSTVNSRTCLKIMVSPVRVRVPPPLFCKDLQEKRKDAVEPRL